MLSFLLWLFLYWLCVGYAIHASPELHGLLSEDKGWWISIFFAIYVVVAYNLWPRADEEGDDFDDEEEEDDSPYAVKLVIPCPDQEMHRQSGYRAIERCTRLPFAPSVGQVLDLGELGYDTTLIRGKVVQLCPSAFSRVPGEYTVTIELFVPEQFLILAEEMDWKTIQADLTEPERAAAMRVQ